MAILYRRLRRQTGNGVATICYRVAGFSFFFLVSLALLVILVIYAGSLLSS